MTAAIPNDLARALRAFFADHLPRVRGTSPHTIRSYRDSLVLLLRLGYRHHSCRVEGRRVAGRASVALPTLSPRVAGRRPWVRFLPPLSEPGVPISGTGLSSGIMRLAHGFPVATSGRVLRAVAPSPHPCAGRPVRRQAC